MRHLLLILYIALAIPPLASAAVDYLEDVKPILARHCHKCHGARDQRNGLRLDTAAAAMKGGKHGTAIQPGNARASLLVQALRGTADGLEQMPHKSPPLETTQIQLIARWIDEGAPAPANEPPEDPMASGRDHWSFTPPKRPEVPAIRNPQSAIQHPIDAFILRRLEQERIEPSPLADRHTLIRRLSLDLTGLPPSVDEVEAFVTDTKSDAWMRWVERMLDSPRYGERWGRWWLDVARYADSNGYSIDAPREIWLYRDWVIDAFNRNLPFDQFVMEQIAGDMLPDATRTQRIATGFHRNTQINQEGGIDKEQFRVESIIDRMATTGSAFLGLTIGCVQCHTHKYDPIEHAEYYRMFAFFNNQDEPVLEVPTPEELERRKEHADRVARAGTELKEYEKSLHGRENDWASGLKPAERAKLPKEAQEALDQTADTRSEKAGEAIFKAYRDQDAGYKKRQADLAKLRRARPGVTSTLAMAERRQPRETFVHIKGDFTRHGERVSPGVPVVLHPLKTDGAKEVPDRLDFARWLASRENPLLARVTVNRIWQQYFGRGLVETENDFGTQGLPPSHPDLLDWLACEFMDHGWSVKHIHRLILSSDTYRRSSHARPDLALKDPTNKLLAHQNRLRLDAELVRDVALRVSGLLTDTIGGPSVFPPLPEGVMSLGQVKRTWRPDQDADRYRRGMYTFFYRATPHPALAVFDAPDAFSACTRRPRSNTPLQALTLLNDEGFHEFARAFGQRILRESPPDDASRLRHAFQLCLARPPAAGEQATLQQLLKDHAADPEETRWATVARVLLNLDETITRE